MHRLTADSAAPFTKSNILHALTPRCAAAAALARALHFSGSEIIMSNPNATQPVTRPSNRSWFQWITGSAVVVLVASILTGCFVETGHYHHRRHVIVVR
jgi:hypothetical protein